MTYFIWISFTARFAQDAEDAELKVFSFAVERTAKENQSAFILLQLYISIKLFFPVGTNSLLLSALSAESNKKNDSLRSLRLCGENKTLYVIVFKNICTTAQMAIFSVY